MAKEIYFEDINIGDAMPAFTSDPLTRTHLVRYAGASGELQTPCIMTRLFVAMFRNAAGYRPRNADHGDNEPCHLRNGSITNV